MLFFVSFSHNLTNPNSASDQSKALIPRHPAVEEAASFSDSGGSSPGAHGLVHVQRENAETSMQCPPVLPFLMQMFLHHESLVGIMGLAHLFSSMQLKKIQNPLLNARKSIA